MVVVVHVDDGISGECSCCGDGWLCLWVSGGGEWLLWVVVPYMVSFRPPRIGYFSAFWCPYPVPIRKGIFWPFATPAPNRP